jgi:rhodanese-related sulfurtransferase
MNAGSTRHFDRGATYVTYCDSVGCNASTKGALKLAELGFQVKELIGGIDWWKRDGYPTESSLVAIG